MQKLGQHFLKDSAVAERMVKYAKVCDKDVVLEIGPGYGIITEQLAEKAKKVIAIEKDASLAEQLKRKKLENVKIITGDALKINWPKFNKIIANLPFNISSPLTFKLFNCSWDSAVLIYQKEVGQRFVAKLGDKNYSRLTVAANYYCNAEILEAISRGKIWPVPKVDCIILRLKQKKPEFATDEFFWSAVAKLFQHKRKLVRAALKVAKFDSNVIKKLPAQLAEKRVVRCSLADFKKISDELR